MAEDSEVVAVSPVAADKKRKIEELDAEPVAIELPSQENGEKPDEDQEKFQEDQEKPDENPEKPDEELEKPDEKAQDGEENAVQEAPDVEESLEGAPEAKRPRLDEPDHQAAEAGDTVEKSEDVLPENSEDTAVENSQQPTPGVPQETIPPNVDQQPQSETETSHKIEVPNNKVGVLIGKAGDTIRYLQYNSGAKIQITRDVDADPSSTTRSVELIGTPENINKAEQLIKDVIAEAEAGGSPALVARGFAVAQNGGEQLQIQVPNDKVGLIIGKGGETIKSLQTRSGARIQLVPQHLPEGDVSKERTIRVTGSKQQIETARDMIKVVMNQAPVRPLAPAGANQQAYRPGGPPAMPQWGARPPPPAQQMGYDYQRRGPYPSQTQYPPQSYGGYSQQPPPRGGFNPGWDQRPAATQGPPQAGGYGYYAQGGHVTEPPSSAPVPAPSQVGYNYGQAQGGSGYGQPPAYSQSMPPQQGYGQYPDSGYEKANPTQQFYGGQQPSSQPGYPPQAGFQSGYMQEPYNKPGYDNMSQGPAPQSYGPPRAAQPGEVPQQGSAPPAYGSNVPSQQPYPYASGAPPQQSYPYATAPPTNDGYNQQPVGSATAPGYGQPAGQAGGYGQYPSQPGYGDHQAPANPGYGYQAHGDASYTNMQAAPYSGPTNNAQGYGPPTANAPSYDQQSAPQPGYGGYGGNAAMGYAKTLSPQPGYGQYDSSQMYGRH
ncbi:uncharacterized protein LOC116246440 [Nymphaea colorata]|nr:uncharacterized protein LOC116246440 [Nymphaea colorata]